jgi:RNA polymerase sigma factor (sigma-70 family)
MASQSFEQFLAVYRVEIERMFATSGASRWSVSLEDFAQAAWQGIRPGAELEPLRTSQLLSALRSGDLALALGCAQENEPAWDKFCSEYRTVLYDAGYALAREESKARDLADSMLAELFGVERPEASQRSLFAYFHGRSSLKTWLRAVVYQKFVNEVRRESRLEPLPEEPAAPVTRQSSVSAEDDRRYADCLGEAVEMALRQLLPQEKLLVSYHYVQQLTLKQIGRLTGEHEATISRHLEAVRRNLRRRIENYLRRVKKLSAYEVDCCLDFASRGVTMELERALRPE